MPAKLVPYVVFMPEGWNYSKCVCCATDMLLDESVTGCGLESIAMCPLANAKKAVAVKKITKTILYPKTYWEVNGKSKTVTLYAVEENTK